MFATLRREAPISFFPQLVRDGEVEGPGNWALTRHEDIHFVSRHPELFSSEPNIMMGDAPAEVAENLGSIPFRCR